MTGDFNGDKKSDIAVANSTSNAVSILAGNGDGTFLTHVDYAVGSPPSPIVTGDFNLDGVLDLVVSNSLGANVSILLGKGNRTFLTHVDYAAGVTPMSLTVGDFNRDGFEDLAVANQGSSTIAILVANALGGRRVKRDLSAFGVLILGGRSGHSGRLPLNPMVFCRRRKPCQA